jgi:hypothetical protein
VTWSLLLDRSCLRSVGAAGRSCKVRCRLDRRGQVGAVTERSPPLSSRNRELAAYSQHPSPSGAIATLVGDCRAFVLQTMVDHRLLTVDEDVTGEPRVDLAHEIMISAWSALAGWIRSQMNRRRASLCVDARNARLVAASVG